MNVMNEMNESFLLASLNFRALGNNFSTPPNLKIGDCFRDGWPTAV